MRNTIVITAAPAGRFLEGTIDGTPLPGVMMEIVPGTALDARGRQLWRPFDGTADGERGLVVILRENYFLGKGVEDAYADGDACYLYCPIPGDELMVRVSQPGTGTGDSVASGDKLIVNKGDGTFIPTTGAPESEPFQVEEGVDDVTSGGTLVLCFYTGH